MATDKLTFYKGKVIPKSQLPREELNKMEQGQTVIPVPQTQEYRQPVMHETQHAQQLPPQFEQEQIRKVAIENEIRRQQALRQQQEEQAYNEQMIRQQMIEQAGAQQGQQAMAPVKVSIYLRDSLKMDVFVDYNNFDQFIGELNEAIATNSAFAVGKKTLNASKIIYYEPNNVD